MLPPQSYTGPASPEGYAARLLSRDANEDVVAAFERELGVSHERHGEELRKIRTHAPEQYDLLIRGDSRAALKLAVAQGDPTAAFLRPIVTDHVLLLCVATGHVRIGELKHSGTNPVVGFSGQAPWPTMAQVAKSALVEPAINLHTMQELDVAEDAPDAQAIQALREAGILKNDDASEWLVTLCKQIHDEMPAKNLTAKDAADCMRGAVELTTPLRTATPKDIRKAGWMRRSFTLERYGVDTPAGAVIVAANLLLARSRIDSCIDAILANAPLPKFDFLTVPAGISNNALARTTEALRVEGQSDKSAPSEIADRENHNSKALVITTRTKIANGEINGALSDLRIDPAKFFRYTNG